MARVTGSTDEERVLSADDLLSRGIRPITRKLPAPTDPRAVLAQALLAVGTAARGDGDLPSRLSSICAAMTDILGCDRSSVFLVVDDEVVPTANHGNPPDIAARFLDVRFSIRHPLFALAIGSDTPVHVSDAPSKTDLLSQELVEQARLTSLIAARVATADGRVGVITAEFNETNADFGEFDAVVVDGLAHIASLVLDDVFGREREAALIGEILHRSEHDELTGLPNRRSLSAWFEQLGFEFERHEPVAVLVADLDRFKAVNDTFGHAAGDLLLTTVADRFRRDLEVPGAKICRLGGDEFVIAAPVADLEAAEQLAALLALSLLEPVEVAPGKTITTTASVGIAMTTVGDLDADIVLSDADAAMYVAKSRRRGRSVFAKPENPPVVSRRFSLELSLPMALREHQIEPWFQPIFDARSGRCVAAEALARWHHPERGLLGPADFLPTVTEMGFLRELTECIVEQAAHVLTAGSLATITTFVNLSVHDIDDGLLGRLTAKFPDPSRLAIELTEGDAMQQTTDVVAILTEVRTAGIRVALDDFGTGYSSLSLLGEIPLDIVKIDRSLVAGLPNERHAEILRATIRLGQALGLSVVAEGIDERPQLDEVVESGVDLVQGYLLGRPMPLADLISIVSEEPPQRVGSSKPFGGSDRI